MPAEEKGAAHYSEVFILMARYWGVGNLRAAMALGEKASQQLRQLSERGKVRWAHSLGRLIGLNQVFLGECEGGYAKLKEVKEYFDSYPVSDDPPLGVMDDQAMASSYLMFAAWQVGAVGEAHACARDALARASMLGHRGTIVNHYSNRLVLCNGHLDSATLLEEAERLLELAEQSGIPYFLRKPTPKAAFTGVGLM